MEATTRIPPARSAVDAATIAEALRLTAASHPDAIAVRTADERLVLSWSQLLARADALAGGLDRLGVGRGDAVALVLSNRPEFAIADLAAVTLGATPFSVYLTLPASEIRFLLADSGARVAIVERSFESVLVQACEGTEVEHVIVVDADGGPGRDSSGDGSVRDASRPGRGAVLALADVEGSAPEFDAAAAAARVGPDDLLTLIYTSGTTGNPKGVQITHRAGLAAARAVREVIDFPEGARVISWLPAAHIAERMAHHYIPIVHAGSVTCVGDPREIVAHLPRVRPNWFFAVPRIWEKLKAGLEAMQEAQPEEQARPVREALAASLERVRLRQAGRPVPPELEAAVAAADERLFSKLREMLGFDQAIAVNCGAAPTPVEVVEFFHAIGIELAELWGMSETCGAGTCNRPGQVRIGTVGPASPGVELRIADDGEVLCRGECVMVGYRNRPELTADALDADGWLHTGDIGRLDEDGYLTIIDRKKEIIINSAGKNMSPSNIEAAVKSGSPLIGQACCIGDRRQYNTALIVLDADYTPQWAARNGLEERGFEQLAAEPLVREAVQAGIDAANARLARVEQIKRFEIVPGDWPAGGDELTPTLKLKRRPIASKYAQLIERMYL